MDTRDRKKLTILSVEDSPMIQKMHEVEFAPFVKEFRVASSVMEALTIIDACKNAIDLILMDIDLCSQRKKSDEKNDHTPLVAMDGLELALHLKGEGINLSIPIVVISGLALPPETKALYKHIVDRFYVKPLTSTEAEHLVKYYSGRRVKKSVK